MNGTERLAEIRQNLVDTFDESEFRMLCFDLGMDYDALSGHNKAEKARELLAHLDQTGHIPELIVWCERRCPDIPWELLVARAEGKPRPNAMVTPSVTTSGGAYVGGSVTTGGGDFVGRDQINITKISEPMVYNVEGLSNPFLGLRAFAYEDRAAYAGRRRSIEEAVVKLTQPGEERTVLFITGASGSGKSSFAQAGLVPALKKFYAERHCDMPFAIFRPAKHPLAMLRDALLQVGVQDLANRPAGTEPILLIVDQFEELFTQSQAAERDALLIWLGGLPPFTQSRAHVIATLRSDYLKELFDTKPVWDLAMENRIELREMTVNELQDAIQRPLQARYPDGMKRFEPALLDRLAQDASTSPTLLPLLQVTLEEVWKKGKLTLANYGTLTDAIKQRADQVLAFRDYDAASPSQPRSLDEQVAVLATFLDLVSVTLDEDPRQVRVSREIEALSPERRKLIDDLTRARLLSVTTAPEAETVSIIHESLISNWQRLKEAVAQERDQLAF